MLNLIHFSFSFAIDDEMYAAVSEIVKQNTHRNFKIRKNTYRNVYSVHIEWDWDMLDKYDPEENIPYEYYCTSQLEYLLEHVTKPLHEFLKKIDVVSVVMYIDQEVEPKCESIYFSQKVLKLLSELNCVIHVYA